GAAGPALVLRACAAGGAARGVEPELAIVVGDRIREAWQWGRPRRDVPESPRSMLTKATSASSYATSWPARRRERASARSHPRAAHRRFAARWGGRPG